MMTDKVFMVVQSGGQWEDSWSTNLCAFTTNEKAEAHVALRVKQDAFIIELKKVVSEHYEKWSLANQIPAGDKQHVLPKMPAQMPKIVDRTEAFNQMIADIQRERSRLGMLNAAINQSAADARKIILKLWNIERDTFVVRYCAEHLTDDLCMTVGVVNTRALFNAAYGGCTYGSRYEDVVRYDIEPVQVME